MKLGMVCYPSFGGSGVVATELGKQLARRGHEIHFITYERPFKLNRFYENIYFHEVEEILYPVFKYTPYTLSLASKIVSVTRQAGLDLIHVHYAMPHSISAFLAKQMLQERNLPVVTTLHGTDITLVGAQEEFLDITRLGIEKSDGVTAVSQSLASETKDMFATEREIEVIHNFIDPFEFRRISLPALRDKFASPQEKIVIHISNFRTVKRVCDVIRTFDLITRQVPAKLLLVGDGPEIGNVEKTVAQLGLQSKVIFLGKQESVVELLSISDLFLLTSEKESFGLVALEAMSCEVPVVASNVGGIPEVVIDKEAGFLVSAGDIENMAQRSIEVLTDGSLWPKLSKRAREIAIEKFHVDQAIPKYEEIYQKIYKRVT